MKGTLLTEIVTAIRSLILDLATLFFLTVAVAAAFTSDFNISSSSALIAIALLLINLIEAVKQKR